MRYFQHAASDVSEQLDLAGIGRPYDQERLDQGLQRMHTARGGYLGRDWTVPPATWDGQRYHVTFPDGQVRAVDPPAKPVMPLPVQPFQPPPPPGAAYPVTYA